MMEDQASWEARVPPGALPYQAGLAHELSHSYISHESLDQFLELYVYNMIRTGSPDVAAWVFRRDQTSSFAGVQALLNVYQLIGRDAMSRAYREVYALHPPYGQILSAECRTVFVSQAPLALRDQVATLMTSVIY